MTPVVVCYLLVHCSLARLVCVVLIVVYYSNLTLCITVMLWYKTHITKQKILCVTVMLHVTVVLCVRYYCVL